MGRRSDWVAARQSDGVGQTRICWAAAARQDVHPTSHTCHHAGTHSSGLWGKARKQTSWQQTGLLSLGHCFHNGFLTVYPEVTAGQATNKGVSHRAGWEAVTRSQPCARCYVK